MEPKDKERPPSLEPDRSATEERPASPPEPPTPFSDTQTIRNLLPAEPGVAGVDDVRTEVLPVSQVDDPTQIVNSVWESSGAIGVAVDVNETIHPPKEKARRRKEIFPLTSRVIRVTGGRDVSTEADFSLLDIIGRGGMGVVYEAWQTSLRRPVALKILHEDTAADEHNRMAFIAEAVITGALDHPNIVPAHELAVDGTGRLFFVMKRILGKSWRKSIRTLPLEDNLEILLKVMDAVAFAHSRGVIHLDLKPENVMLGEYGEVLLTDWGVATVLNREGFPDLPARELTLGGTPSYMAPEMARGELHRLGRHTDIYLVGGLLFEIITGKRPHIGHNVISCLTEAALNHLPESPVRGELMEIALTALSERPRRRFQSIAAMRQAIKNYKSHAESVALATRAEADLAKAVQSDDYDDYAQSAFGFREAVKLWPDNENARQGLARVTGAYAETAYRRGDYDLALNWLSAGGEECSVLRDVVLQAKKERAARKRRLRTLSRVSLALGAAVLVVLSVAFFWIRSEREAALEARQAAEAARDAAQWELYRTGIREADRLSLAGRTADALQVLAELPFRLRGWEHAFLEARCRRVDAAGEKSLAGHAEAVMGLAYSPDGRWLASGSNDGTLRVWSAADGRPVKTLAARTRWTGMPAFSPDGRLLLACSGEIWQTGAFTPTGALAGTEESVFNACLSPDGKTAAAIDAVGRVCTWDFPSGRKRLTLADEERGAIGIAFSPDGRTLAYGTAGGQLRLCDAATGKRLQSCRVDGETLGAVAFSPDGSTVAVCSRRGRLKAFRVSTGVEERVFQGFGGSVPALAFTRDGRWLAGNCSDGVLRLWDPAQGRLVAEIKGQHSVGIALAMHPDGVRFASGGYDKIVRTWRLQESRAIVPLPSLPAGKTLSASLPAGDGVVAGSEDGAVRLFTGKTGAWRVLAGTNGPVTAVAVSPDGRLVAAAGEKQPVVLLADLTGSGLRPKSLALPPVPDPNAPAHPTALAWFPDGNRLAVGDSLGRTFLLDVAARKWTPSVALSWRDVSAVCLSPDGRTAAWADATGALVLTDVAGGRVLFRVKGGTDAFIWPSGVVFSPDSRLVAMGCWDKTVGVFDARSGRPVASLAGHAGWCVPCFGRDGRRLFSAGADGTLMVWDTRTWSSLLRIRVEEGKLSAPAVDARDGRLLVAGTSGTVRVYSPVMRIPLPLRAR